MPLRVPEDVSVTPQPISRPIIEPYKDTGLGDLGKAIGQASDVGGKIYQDILRQQKAASITGAMAKFRQAITEKLYDPNKGAITTLRGEKAIGSAKFVYGELDKLKAELLAKELPSEDAKRVFGAKADQMMDVAVRQLDVHEAREQRTAAIATIDALQENNLIALSNSYSDPNTREALIKEVEGPMMLQALSPEQGEAAVAKWRQQAHLTILNGYVNGRDYQGAKTYYHQIADKLGPAKTQVKNMLDKLDRSVQAEEIAGKIRDAARAGDPEGWVMNPDLAYSQLEAANFEDPYMKDEVRRELDEQMGVEKMKQDARITNNFNAALSIWNKTHNIKSIPIPLQNWLNFRAPKLWAGLLSDNEMYWRRRREDSRQSRTQQNYDNQTARDWFLAQSVQDQANTVLEKWAAGRHLDDNGKAEIAKLIRVAQDHARKGWDANLTDFVRGGFAHGPYINPNSTRAKNLRSELTNEFNAFVLKAQRPPTMDEVNKMWGNIWKKNPVSTPIWTPWADDFQFEWERRRDTGESPDLDYIFDDMDFNRGPTILEQYLDVDGTVHQRLSDGTFNSIPPGGK